MHAYIKSSGFIGGKGPRSLKKISFCQIKGKVQSELLHNYLSEAGCFFTESTKVHNTQHMRLVAIDYEYAMLLRQWYCWTTCVCKVS